jgi:light-regulated signal transduction histidine kinase (bacteriophytochrome)
LRSRERAFSNLVDNAVKFAGEAELAIARQGKTVVIDVADHGPGIPPEGREAMLEPFRRGSENRRLDPKGLDLDWRLRGPSSRRAMGGWNSAIERAAAWLRALSCRFS